MVSTYRTILLCAVVGLGFAARAATFKSPLLDHHGWRQAATASIARNFYRERFNPLYPQVDQRGADDIGFVETGFELLAFCVAAISMLVGEFYIETGRLLNSLLFIGSALLLYQFVRLRNGPAVAVVSVCAYALGFPLSLYIDRSFMNEALLIFLTFAALRAAQLYLRDNRRHDLATVFLATTLIGVIKLPWLIVWAPLLGLLLEKHGRRALTRWEPYVLAGVNLAFVWLWYSHAMALGSATGLSFGMTDKLFDVQLVASWGFPLRLVRRLARDVLGPVGIVALCVGLAAAYRHRRWCETLGIAGFGAYLLLVAKGNDVHDYYQLPIVPIAAVLVGQGVVHALDALTRRKLIVTDGAQLRVLAMVVGLMVFSTWARSVSAHSWYEVDWRKVHLCETADSLLSTNDRLLFVGYNNPDLLFCMDKKGWLLPEHLSDAQHITEAWIAGATVAVIPASYDSADVTEQIRASGTVLVSNDAFRVYRLQPFRK